MDTVTEVNLNQRVKDKVLQDCPSLTEAQFETIPVKLEVIPLIGMLGIDKDLNAALVKCKQFIEDDTPEKRKSYFGKDGKPLFEGNSPDIAYGSITLLIDVLTRDLDGMHQKEVYRKEVQIPAIRKLYDGLSKSWKKAFPKEGEKDTKVRTSSKGKKISL